MDKHVTRFADLENMVRIVNQNDEEMKHQYMNLVSNSFPKKTNGQRNVMGLSELKSLTSLVKKLLCQRNIIPEQMQGFILNYTFYEGVREEFDVLRFTRKMALNIELKQQCVKSIREQLIRHKYLLSLLKMDVSLFVYIEDQEQLLYLNEQDELEEATFGDLLNLFKSEYLANNPLQNLDLTDLIVSPYTDPARFQNHDYYLTENQQEVEDKILKSQSSVIALTGGPGSGKTIVLIDIARKEIQAGKSVLVIFSSQMEQCEADEISRILRIPIMPIKLALFDHSVERYDVLLVDEAQRLREDSFKWIAKLPNNSKVFSCDQKQTLHPAEKKLNILAKVLSMDAEKVELKQKVRSDPALSSFIQKMLNLKSKGVQPYDYDHVHAVFFERKGDALEYMDNMKKKHGYTIIEPTEYKTKTTLSDKRTKLYYGSRQTHSTIGREYDNVLVPLDNNYAYEDGNLISVYDDYYPYNEESLLFESLTRVKRELAIVVINNISIYKTILQILSWKNDKLYHD